jgi:hypothetical protein
VLWRALECANAAVRRNASLAVARLVKAHRGCEQRIRDLRGMEILITLSRDGGFKELAGEGPIKSAA